MAMSLADEPITAEGYVFGTCVGLFPKYLPDILDESSSTCSDEVSTKSSFLDSDSDLCFQDSDYASMCSKWLPEEQRMKVREISDGSVTDREYKTETEVMEFELGLAQNNMKEDKDALRHPLGDVCRNCTQICDDSVTSTGEVQGELQQTLEKRNESQQQCTLRQRKTNSEGNSSKFAHRSAETQCAEERTGKKLYSQRLTEWCLRLCPDWVFEPEVFIEHPEKVANSCVHRNADSFFTTSSGFNNYRGFLNLCIILLVVSNCRLFLENLIKYGFRGDPLIWLKLFFRDPYNWPNILLILSTNLFILTTFAVEKLLARGTFSNVFGSIIYGVVLSTLLVYPAVVVFIAHPNPVVSSVCLAIVTVVILKLISYGSVNYWCRLHRAESRTLSHRRRKSTSLSEGKKKTSDSYESEKIAYPDNLTLADLYYFMFAPTLSYEINFPRSQRIRKRFLLKRVLEMTFLIQLMLVLVQQWMVPGIQNSVKPLANMDIFHICERLLKLAIPNHFIWLIFFYWMFHSCLNVIAELLMFGDREFYRDWWNAEDISEFWKNWNIPVHRWCVRHVYKPLRSRGWGNLQASTMVFCISAFFHEYLVSIPLQMFKIWALSGMIMQIPLAYFTRKLLKGKMGNMAMWLSLIMGQPICILAYLHDYYIIHVVPYAGNATQPQFTFSIM